jgi:hypothetical protein
MNITQRPSARRIRTAAVAAVATGAGLAGLLGMGGAAQASTAAHHVPAGYVTVDSCSSLAGKITYSPGLLTTTRRSVHAVMTGTTAGCSDIFNGPLSGTGTFTALLAGKVSVSAENFSGTFTINWPAASGFNPSNGSLTVTESNGLETISGSVSSGFDTGAVLSGQYVITGKTGKGTKLHPVTAQTYVNTQPLSLSRNEG